LDLTRMLLRQTVRGRLVEPLPLSPGAVPRPGAAAERQITVQPL
jgi:hypothetical protein